MLRDELINKVREPLHKLFPDLLLTELGLVTDKAEFYFNKGITYRYGYEKLSGGEKAAFDLLLDFVIKNQYYKNTIFCIDDQKEDWWNVCGGKTIGPRIELRKEFFAETGHRFHMYTMTSFLSFFYDYKDKIIDKKTIDEVETLSSNAEYIRGFENSFNYIEHSRDRERNDIERLKLRIDMLQAKNKKRQRSINVLNEKMKHRPLTYDENVALIRNQQNYNEDSELIKQFQKRIETIIQYPMI